MRDQARRVSRARRARLAFVIAGAASIGVGLHCGSSADNSVFPDESPCATVYRDKCGTPCVGDLQCPEGLHCGPDGRCFAECAPGTPPCSNGSSCSPKGRCGDDPGPGPIIGGDAGPLGDAAFGDSSCADIDVTLSKIIPTVVLLIDQSGSMIEQFPPGSGQQRWDVLRNALMDPDGGIVKRLENDVSFGLTLYSWRRTEPTCPELSSVSFKLGNYDQMFALYADAGTLDNTPTKESIMGVIGFDDAGVLYDGGFARTSTPGPKILVLATDGDPDTCVDPDSNGQQGPRNGVVWATQRAYDAGIPTYVIAIGADIDQAHQQEVANAGLGFNPDAGDAAPLFRTNNRQELVDAFNKVILGVRSCKFTLNGSVVSGTETLGTVKLNGVNLGFNDPNGWKLNSPTELEIVGTSCTTVKTTPNAQVSVRFPCGAVIPR